VPVFERTWGFKSPLAHSGLIAVMHIPVGQERPPRNRRPFLVPGLPRGEAVLRRKVVPGAQERLGRLEEVSSSVQERRVLQVKVSCARRWSGHW
jgi:hypothetical protein